jgi:hypothetical protein
MQVSRHDRAKVRIDVVRQSCGDADERERYQRESHFRSVTMIF